MAVLNTGFPTLLDASKQFTSDGTALPLAELLHKINPSFDDIPWEMSNSTTGHRISARQELPAVTLRKLNGGVLPTKSQYGDINESMALFEAQAKVDEKLVQLQTNTAQFRLNQNIGHIEAMNQRFSQSLFYGDPDVTPEEFLGIAPRLDAISAGGSAAPQIIDAGGNDTDLTSIYLIGWGPTGAMGIYPKGSNAGLTHHDMGVDLVNDDSGTGAQFRAYRDVFQLDAGLAVYDYRNLVRIANIDLSNLTKDAATGADLIDLMVQAAEQINNEDSLNLVWYMPRKIRAFLRRQITNRDNVWLSMGEVAGRPAVMFDGKPVRRVDSILLNESRVT